MKLAHTFYTCRCDDDVPFGKMFGSKSSQDLIAQCAYYEKGKCISDGKKCIIVKYIKEK
jgi:hypothetical protein